MIWIEAYVARRQITVQVRIRDVSGKAHTVGDSEIDRERFEVVYRIAVANKHAVEIRPPELAREIAQRPQRIINAVLGIHGANIAKNRSALVLQRLIGLNPLYSSQVRAVPHNEH